MEIGMLIKMGMRFEIAVKNNKMGVGKGKDTEI